uniref:Uncharacterized protein n=1 Tax=Oryza rufipogon TaxID=4529 RepID=A0A0E0NEA6_ORYRU
MIKERSIHRSAALILRLLSAFVVRDGAIEMHDAPPFCYFLLTFCFVNCGLLLYAMKNWTQSDQQLTKKSRVHGLLYFFLEQFTTLLYYPCTTKCGVDV